MGGAAASPLAEIERAVQERAKDISLEMTAPGGEVKLRALIADEVARWNDDHRRGRRAFALPHPELVVERAFRNLARYGPLTPLLADDDVWEVMVSAPDGAFHYSAGATTAGPPPYDVYEVTPTTAFGFGTDGTLTPTRWRFGDQLHHG